MRPEFCNGSVAAADRSIKLLRQAAPSKAPKGKIA